MDLGDALYGHDRMVFVNLLAFWHSNPQSGGWYQNDMRRTNWIIFYDNKQGAVWHHLNRYRKDLPIPGVGWRSSPDGT